MTGGLLLGLVPGVADLGAEETERLHSTQVDTWYMQNTQSDTAGDSWII